MEWVNWVRLPVQPSLCSRFLLMLLCRTRGAQVKCEVYSRIPSTTTQVVLVVDVLAPVLILLPDPHWIIYLPFTFFSQLLNKSFAWQQEGTTRLVFAIRQLAWQNLNVTRRLISANTPRSRLGNPGMSEHSGFRWKQCPQELLSFQFAKNTLVKYSNESEK